MWHWVLCGCPARTGAVLAEAGRAGWQTLGAYSRGTMFIAAIDALGIGLALVVLRVPLALPLALITFLGGFVPIIGATVAGAVAVLVALAANGPTTALLTLAAVIAVQQIEGNLLEPLIMKRQVQLHPAVILVAVTAGTLIAGIAGAFVGVPITAVLWRVIDTVQRHRESSTAPPACVTRAGRSGGNRSGGDGEAGGEPGAGLVGDLLQGAGLLEEVGGAGDDPQLADLPQLGQRPLVERDHLLVQAADEQQRRGAHLGQRGAGQVRPAAPGRPPRATRSGRTPRRPGRRRRPCWPRTARRTHRQVAARRPTSRRSRPADSASSPMSKRSRRCGRPPRPRPG